MTNKYIDTLKTAVAELDQQIGELTKQRETLLGYINADKVTFAPPQLQPIQAQKPAATNVPPNPIDREKLLGALIPLPPNPDNGHNRVYTYRNIAKKLGYNDKAALFVLKEMEQAGTVVKKGSNPQWRFFLPVKTAETIL